MQENTWARLRESRTCQVVFIPNFFSKTLLVVPYTHPLYIILSVIFVFPCPSVPLSQVLDDAEDDDGCLEDEASLNERRLVSRYGVWLLVGLCTPEPDTPMSTFGHMLSMLFQVK